ncbi:uncharacterized protein LOC124172776 [Ischnura elegans]|uniref:uncharacterized protein LOC124172776 n=1 Tax=Ischnura elegans TaxID=197161 RepID=UPI001ED88BD2|nr:uncharacterized protein LOC124172776 [Ischnura elegans]XP_046408222.1 uncharacterized protein LOC124172776 [Ischnura elegans]
MSGRMLITKIIMVFIVWSVRVDNFLGLPSALVAEGSTAKPAEEFSCYQCSTSSPSDKCGPEDLKPCKQPADRCYTTIRREPGEPFNVVRECALGPCQSEIGALVSLVGDGEHCDVSKPHVNCLLCCRDSGCNAADSLHTSAFFFVSIVLAILYTS